MLSKLVGRGDYIAIEKGKLVVQAKSGKPVPGGWFAEHEKLILQEILRLADISAYRFARHTTGHYGAHKSGGVALHYVDLLTGETSPIVFNADLDRARNTRSGGKGHRLPKGHFRVRRDYAFTTFWLRMGLSLPSRLSEFHKRIGKLKAVVVTGATKDSGKLDKQSLKPLEITREQILSYLNLGDNLPTTFRQGVDKVGTRTGDKEIAVTHAEQGLQANSGTCANDC